MPPARLIHRADRAIKKCKIARLKKRAILIGGDEETRTPDPLHAKQVLYQLSYIPKPS